MIIKSKKIMKWILKRLTILVVFVSSLNIRVAAETTNTSSARGTDSITEEQLFMVVPSYLNDLATNRYLTLANQIGQDAFNSVTDVKQNAAVLSKAFQSGIKIVLKEAMASIGVGESEYETACKKNAMVLLTTYIGNTSNMPTIRNLGKVFKNTSSVIGFEKKAIIEYMWQYKDYLLIEHKGEMKKSDIEGFVGEKLDVLEDSMKVGSQAVSALQVILTQLELYNINLSLIEHLLDEVPYDTDLYKGLEMLYNDYTMDPWGYIGKYYFNKAIVDTLLKEFDKAMFDAIFSGGGVPLKVAHKLVGICCKIYDHFYPTVEDIVDTTMARGFSDLTDSMVTDWKNKFMRRKATIQDTENFQVAYTLRICALKIYLDNSKRCLKSFGRNTKDIEKAIDLYSNGVMTTLSYSNYINHCITCANEDIKNGLLEIDDEIAKQKTDTGVVIDDKYDSTESIKARLAIIQSQYVPNSGQQWFGNYGGATQCFGFARMIFSMLFGVELSPCYYGSRRYVLDDSPGTVLVSQLIGSNVTSSALRSMFAGAKIGDIIQVCGNPYGQHTMMFVGLDDSGIYVYDCNSHINSGDPDCLIHQWHLSFDFIARNYSQYYTSGNSEAGVSLYRASNYASIYGDGDDIFFDDTVNFVIVDGVLKKYNGVQKFVVIPDTVIEIGPSAFEGNDLWSVSIPDSVVGIDDKAFYNCASLMGINVPDTVEYIGKSAFEKCGCLATALLPENTSFDTIQKNTFSECVGLNNINIPSQVTDIENYAFNGCSTLYSVSLPEELSELNVGVFNNCKVLPEITLPANLSYAEGSWWCEKGPFAGCDELRTVNFADGFFRVHSALFQDCSGLEEITLPETLLEIGDYAFKNCQKLSVVNFPNGLESIGKDAFVDCKSLQEVVIPDSVFEVKQEAFKNCESLSNVVLPKSLEELNSGVFLNCSNLSSIELPVSLSRDSTVIFMGDGPFEGTGLKNVVFDDGFTVIPVCLFQDCSSLTEITIPETVTKLANSAFLGCTGIREITLPQGLNELGRSVFKNCSSLESIEIPSGVTILDQNEFDGCSNLSSVILSENLIEIGKESFLGCTKLTGINLPTTLEKIGTGSFKNCSALKQISIPDSVSFMGTDVFNGCSKLTSANHPKSTEKITTREFANCTTLTKIEIPEGVKEIQNEAFVNDSFLKDIYIPKSVTKIVNSIVSNTKKITIHGYAGSFAETYANNNSIKFVVIEEKNTYEVIFDSTGGTEVPSQTVEEGGKATKPEDPTKEGNNFDGWYLGEELYDFDTEVTDNLSLVARWSEIVIPIELTKVEAKDPTCTEDGNIEYWVDSNGKRFKDEAGETPAPLDEIVIRALGHDFGEWGSVAPATCIENGEERRVCSRNEEHVETRSTENSNAHQWGEWIESVAPTEESVGTAERTCELCQKTETITIPVIGHEHNLQTIEQADPTCVEEGHITYYYCEDCGNYYSDPEAINIITQAETVIPKKGHDLVHHFVLNPSCEHEGILEHWVCKQCKTIFSDENGENVIFEEGLVIPSISHSWDEGVVIKEPTSTEDGIKQYTCLNDSAHTKTESIPAQQSGDEVDITIQINTNGDNESVVAVYPENWTQADITADLKSGANNAVSKATMASGNTIYKFESLSSGSYILGIYKAGYLLSIQEISTTNTTINTSLRHLGDVDNNGDTTVSDIIMIRDIILEEPNTIRSLTEESKLVADVNQDGNVTVSDIIMVRDRILDILGEDYQKKN